jgi:purine-nucleoside phosphorylase
MVTGARLQGKPSPELIDLNSPGATMCAFQRLTHECAAHRPHAFVVLGSGMGSLVGQFTTLAEASFGEVPGLPPAMVEGHKGRLVLGRRNGKGVLLSQGRLHYYEGHPWEVVIRPVQIASELGIKVVILTNAAGGIREDLVPGTLMPIRAHLEWNRPFPWRQPVRPSPYSKRLLALIGEAGHGTAPGVYASVTGPNYETPAEIRAVRSQAADVVGMSTTREALAAAEAGMEVAAVSLVTNRAAGLSAVPLDHEEVMAVGRQAADRLGVLIDALLARL